MKGAEFDRLRRKLQVKGMVAVLTWIALMPDVSSTNGIRERTSSNSSGEMRPTPSLKQ